MNASQDQASLTPPNKAAKAPASHTFAALCRLYESYLVKAGKARHELLIRYSPKSLHAWRVSLRRVTATMDQVCEAVSDTPPAELVEQLKTYRNATGHSRDLDILLDESIPAFHEAKPKADRLDPALIERLETERQRLHHEALESLQEANIPAVQRGFEAWYKSQSVSDDELKQIAAELLEFRLQQLRKRGERLGEGRKRLHKARTTTKKLRYTMELFEPMFSKEETRRWLDHLAELQTHLGESHDRMTGRMLCKGLLAEHEDRTDLKAFLKWSRKAAQASAIKAATALEHLLRLEHYWRVPGRGENT